MESKLEMLKQTADKETADAQQSADANKLAATNLTPDHNDKKKQNVQSMLHTRLLLMQRIQERQLPQLKKHKTILHH